MNTSNPNPDGKPFRFSPLTIATGSAGEIVIVCLATKRRAVWNDAARAGWVADLNGEPFRAYYSPEGRAQVDGDSHEFGTLPGEGVTLVYTIQTPTGHGPHYSARFWGRNEGEAQAKANAYLAKLPHGHTPDQAVTRRTGH